MGTLVIKNLPERLHDKLRAQAASHHRSVTKEVVTLIESSVTAQPPETDLPPSFRPGGGPLRIGEIKAALVRGPGPSSVNEPPAPNLSDYIGKWPRYRNVDEVIEYVRELRRDRDED